MREVKSYDEVRRMPVEVRRWWIDQMVRDAEERANQGGSQEIPRGPGRSF